MNGLKNRGNRESEACLPQCIYEYVAINPGSKKTTSVTLIEAKALRIISWSIVEANVKVNEEIALPKLW